MTATTTESPSALLRRAAGRLDEVLTAMPRGPRRLEYRKRKGTDVVVQIDMHGPPRPGSNVPSFKAYHPSMRAEVEYAMATQPDTMRDIAGMLRSVATMADGLPEVNSVHIIRHALNAARRILGEVARDERRPPQHHPRVGAHPRGDHRRRHARPDRGPGPVRVSRREVAGTAVDGRSGRAEGRGADPG